MADIFISYAREDADAVTRLAAALQEAGYSSWWDRNLTSGSRYLKETEAELKAAKAVLVVWSKASVESHWVADEAAVGRDENRLAAVTFDGSMPPLGFRQFQVTDFSHWRGQANEPQFQSLSGGLSRLAPPSEQAVTRPQAPRWSKLRKPVVLGGAALAALAILAVAVSVLMRPAGAPAGQPASQRIAFFGFDAQGADPAAQRLAKDATDEAFKALALAGIETSARANTELVPPDQRMMQAANLGAMLIVTGEVGSGDGGRLVFRIADISSRTTLWETPVAAGPGRGANALPVRGGTQLAVTLACIAELRPYLTREDPKRLTLVGRSCGARGLFRGGASSEAYNAADRELAEVEPDVAFFQLRVALGLLDGFGYLPPSVRSERIEEAEKLIERARRLDPELPVAAAYQLAMRKGEPLEKQEAMLLAAPGNKHPLGFHLAGVGRLAESLANHQTKRDAAPLSSANQVARTMAYAGRPAEAATLFLWSIERHPVATEWRDWMTAAIFLGAGDPDEVMTWAPEDVPEDVRRCLSDIAAAAKNPTLQNRARGVQLVSSCSRQLFFYNKLTAMLAFGDTEGAFRFAVEEPLFSVPDLRQTLFSPVAQPMRADARFLPLTKKLGLWDYWIATKTHPDVCDLPEERDFEVCVEVRRAQEK